jgi:N-formylglutamate amidohydrolase
MTPAPPSDVALPSDVPFTLDRPSGPAGPLVFASPHSGDIQPVDMGARADLATASLRSAEDALVDRLIASARDHGVAVIAGRISRAYVDLNRAETELDPLLVDKRAAQSPSAKVAAGYGVIPRLSGDGHDLYDRILSAAEVERRLAQVHRPYHQALERLMTQARAAAGAAVLVDWHSMPSRAAGSRGRSRPGLDVVLGDRHGASCAATVTRRLRRLFEQAGWRVGLNQPYAGGYSTQLWGRPAEAFHAVQIELNRSLYLDEATLRPSADFDRCRAVLTRVIGDLTRDPGVG